MTDVMSENQRKVLISYRDQELAIPLYSGAKRRAYYAEDFLELSSLVHVMNQVFVGESDITAAGVKFLREFFSHERLAHILISSGEVDHEGSHEQVVEHLERMVPNEIGDFIKEARSKLK
jgi:hypothetical protein